VCYQFHYCCVDRGLSPKDLEELKLADKVLAKAEKIRQTAQIKVTTKMVHTFFLFNRGYTFFGSSSVLQHTIVVQCFLKTELLLCCCYFG
jgi:hypothetical protein